MLIIHLIRNLPEQQEKKKFQLRHFEVKHQNGSHSITSMGIEINSHLVWKSKQICMNSSSCCSGQRSQPITMPVSVHPRNLSSPLGNIHSLSSTTKLCKLEGRKLQYAFFWSINFLPKPFRWLRFPSTAEMYFTAFSRQHWWCKRCTLTQQLLRRKRYRQPQLRHVCQNRLKV